MELYNTSLRMHGLTNLGILYAFQEMIIIYPICFIMGFFFIDQLVPIIVFQLVNPDEDKPILVILTRANITVTFMCPIMNFGQLSSLSTQVQNLFLSGSRHLSAIFPWHFSGRFFSADHLSAEFSIFYLKILFKTSAYF